MPEAKDTGIDRPDRTSQSSGGCQDRCESCSRIPSLVDRITELELRLTALEKSLLKPAQKRKLTPTHEEAAPSASLWDAYQLAYKSRYHIAPIRNAKVNSLLKQLLNRIGVSDSQALIQFYLGLNDAWLVQHFHPLDGLISKCEGYLTRMKTGVEMSRAKAQKVENVSATLTASQKYLERKYNGTK